MADKYKWVKATGDFSNGGRVVLWERDPVHPNGEIFIGDANPQQVGMSSAVAERIRTGALEVVDAPVEAAETALEADVGGDSGDGDKKPGRPKANA